MPRSTSRSIRGYAHHAEHHAEQIVAEGNPTKEWLQKKHDVEHHAGGEKLYIRNAILISNFGPIETTDLWRKIRCVCFSDLA